MSCLRQINKKHVYKTKQNILYQPLWLKHDSCWTYTAVSVNSITPVQMALIALHTVHLLKKDVLPAPGGPSKTTLFSRGIKLFVVDLASVLSVDICEFLRLEIY